MKRCQLYQRGALIMRAFLFFQTKFFFYISIFGGRKGESEVSAAPMWCPDQYTSIFCFRSKHFFFDINFWRSLRLKGDVSGANAVP